MIDLGSTAAPRYSDKIEMEGRREAPEEMGEYRVLFECQDKARGLVNT